MIGALLLCMFTDTTALSVISSQNPVRVSPGQTAVLPVSLRFRSSAWEFYHVKWEFVTGNQPILVYMVDNCTRAPGSQGSNCQHSLELAGFYRQRVNVSFEYDNASLVLRAAQPEDAGTYRVTVRSLDVSGTALVNLTVEGKFARKNFCTTNTIRLVFASLVLFILALLLGEHIHTFVSNFPACEETLGPSETERHP